MTTEKQKRAVRFCELWLEIEYKGDIEDFDSVSSFLYDHLDIAKSISEDATASYYSNFDY